MAHCRIVINGECVPKGRPRFVRRGNYVQTYTPSKTLEWEAIVREECVKQVKKPIPPDTPVILYISIYMPIPSSLSKTKQNELEDMPHIKRPDADNLLKSILDGLAFDEKGRGLFADDNVVYRILVNKKYSATPRVLIYARWL